VHLDDVIELTGRPASLRQQVGGGAGLLQGAEEDLKAGRARYVRDGGVQVGRVDDLGDLPGQVLVDLEAA
jgi:hypothetical protein